MYRPVSIAFALLAMLPAVAAAADRVSVQLKWVPQTQFAGFYAAHDQGLYTAEGIDAVILPGGPNVAPIKSLRDGRADAIVTWLPDALNAREKGVPLVNIAQMFKRSGLMLTCRKDAGITRPEDFRGRTIGVWFHGNEYPFVSWMNRLGLTTTGGADGVTVMMQGYNVEPLVKRTAHCISTMSYNEYGQVLDAGIKADELVVFRYEDHGVSVLEDGIYVLENRLADPGFLDRMARFVRATLKGWDSARTRPDEAVAAVIQHGKLDKNARTHQRRMLDEIIRLLPRDDEPSGYIAPDDFERTVSVLLVGGSNPVITTRPKGGYTHAVWQRATGRQLGQRD